MQIVYLSNRPHILNDTLIQVQRFMPFVDEVIIIGPRNQLGDFKSALPLTFIEEESLRTQLKFKGNLDHQSLNYHLRVQAILRDEVKEVFIMSDDDARPVRMVTEDIFLTDRYYCYFFYDLSEWHFHCTEFDQGQQNTFVMLKQLGYSTRTFASHMPQIINKKIFLESVEVFSGYSRQYPVCEWTSYFNYALVAYPDRFHDPSTYLTMGWPMLPGDWPPYVIPEQYYFENYDPSLYKKQGVFYTLNPLPTLEESELVLFEKSRRLRMIECGRFIAPAQKNDPWRSKSWKHRILYRFVQWGNGYMRKVFMELRSQRTRKL